MRILKFLWLVGFVLLIAGCGRWVGSRQAAEADALLSAGDYAAAGVLYADAAADGYGGADITRKLIACLLAQGRAREGAELASNLAGPGAWELPAVSDLTRAALSRAGVTQEELNYRKYTEDDIGYLERVAFYWQAAQAIVRGRTSDRDRLMAVLDWCARNIQSGGCAGRAELAAWIRM